MVNFLFVLFVSRGVCVCVCVYFSLELKFGIFQRNPTNTSKSLNLRMKQATLHPVILLPVTLLPVRDVYRLQITFTPELSLLLIVNVVRITSPIKGLEARGGGGGGG